MAIDHFFRAKKAWPLLVKRAQTTCVPFTYKEISNRIGLHHRAARWFLSEIQEFCHENKLAPLQALVVNKIRKFKPKLKKLIQITLRINYSTIFMIYRCF